VFEVLVLSVTSEEYTNYCNIDVGNHIWPMEVSPRLTEKAFFHQFWAIFRPPMANEVFI
jgi:hypothetical protein